MHATRTRLPGKERELQILRAAPAVFARPPAAARGLRENHEGYVRFFAAAIEKGMRDGTIRPDVDPEAMAWLLNSVGFTSTLLQLLGFGHEKGGSTYRRMR